MERLKNLLRRHNYVVNPHLQISMWVSSMGYVAFCFLAIACCLFAQLMNDLHTIDPKSEQAFISAGNLLYVLDNLWLIGLLSMIVISLSSVHLSHKIAGPLHRLTRSLSSMKKGRIPQDIKLRKGDYLQPDVEIINEALAAMRTNVAEISESQDALRTDLLECCQVARDTLNEELNTRLVLLVERASDLESKLASIIDSSAAPAEKQLETADVC